MKVLDEIIFKTFINIHRNEKKAWISLEEIYDTLVEKEKTINKIICQQSGKSLEQRFLFYINFD